MDLYPKQPEMDRPPVVAGVVLVALQILAGFIALAFGTLVRLRAGSALSMLGGICAAMGYSVWLENKVPGALERRSMVLWLSGIATVAQMVLALVYVALISLAAREDGGVQLP